MAVQLSTAGISHLNRGKKRKLHIDNWKQNARKRARDAGEQYLSVRNKTVEAIRPPNEVRKTTLYV